MASGWYEKTKKVFLDGGIDLTSDDIRVILVDTADYTVDLAAHDFLDDVTGAGRVATSGALTNVTTTAGVFDADNPTFSTVTGDASEALVVYKHTGTEGTSNLILYIDSGTGLPVTPNGGDITVSVHASGFGEI